MSKIVFKPFWSYDVVKTENWIGVMHLKGYALKKINFKARLFIFEETMPSTVFYRIVYDKKTNDSLPNSIFESGFESVYCSKKHYILKTTDSNPKSAPSYIGFLSKNTKLKFVLGCVLLSAIIMMVFPLLVLLIFFILVIFSGSFTYENAPPTEIIPPTNADLIGILIYLIINFVLMAFLVWIIYSYFKLKSTNKQLDKLCGGTLDLSFTIPKDCLLSKQEEKALKKNKKLIRKYKLAWVYAPDKIENWLEKMEMKGFNLYRMSRLGNSFFFFKGEPRKVKYQVDFQKKTNPQYYNLNKESGWKLIFTSLSRVQSITVWSSQYTDEVPMFYSDKDSKLKHAKRFAFTYSIIFFPVCLMYIILTIMNYNTFKNTGVNYSSLIVFPILVLEFGFFALRTIFYYFRVKKSLNK